MTTPRLVLLGGFRLHDAAGSPLALSARKAQALLSYVALQPGKRCSRDQLAALLWEESSPPRARQSLRQVLAELRKAVADNENTVVIGEEEVRMPPGGVVVDVHEFEESLEHATFSALGRAIELYQGEFLEGFNPRAPAFEDWLMAERSRLKERAVDALQQLLNQEQAHGGIAEAIRHALRLLALDPLHEPGHRTLMELYARQGHYSAALRQYRICQQKLRRELDVAPEAETEQLYRQIMRHRQDGRSADEPIAAADLKPTAGTQAELLEPTVNAPPEPRQATILLLRPAAAESNPETWRTAAQRFSREAESIVRRYGGVPLHGPGGDLLAVFGIPIAHSDDSERAVRAAMSIREALPNTRIGIASGRVVMVSGVQQWVTGGAVDQATDLATRSSNGEIRVSAPLYTSVAGRVMAERIADDTKHHAWRLEAMPGDVPDDHPTFVGRERERRQLSSALEACREIGCGQTLLVRGEAGIGKSRLLKECRTVAEQFGFACHTVPVLNFGAGGEPARFLVRGLLGLAPEVDQSATRVAARQALADGLIDTAREAELYDVLGLSQPEELVSVYKALDDATRRERRLHLIASLVGSCAHQQPLLLMVEDIHWADPETLEYLARIAWTVADCPALLVMTHRLEGAPLEPAWRGAMDGAPLMTIDLGPLRDSELQAMAASLAAPDDERVRRCIERAGGNPWFLEQLLRSDAADDSAIPDSVRSLIWAQLDRLEAIDKRGAQAAAVLGQHVPVLALRHLLNDASYDATPLVAQRLLKPEGSDYRFSHDLIREGVYESLPASEQRSLHARAAQWYHDSTPTLTARHLDWAASPEAAAAYLDAAREQVRAYRYEQARPLVERGRALAAEPSIRYELLRLQGDILHETGDIDTAIDAYRLAVDASVQEEQRCYAWLGVAAGYGVKDHHQAALAALEEAERAAGHRAAPLARLHTLRGNLLFPLGRIKECLKSHQRARKYAREAGSAELEARALSGLGDAAYLHGRMRTAYGHFDRCVEIARAQELARVEASNLPMRGIARFYQNQLEAAHRDGADAAALARRIGHLRAEILSREVMITVLAQQADWAAVEEQAEQGLELARRLGTQRFEADFLLDMGLSRLGQGRPEEAEDYLDRAYALSRDAVLAYVGPWILGALAVSTADTDKRRWALEEGEALLAAGSLSHSHLHFYEHAIDAALAMSDWTAARRYCSSLETYTRREPLPWSDFFIARGRVLADWHSGEGGSAVRHEIERLAQEGEQAGLHTALPTLHATLSDARS